jgi:hypothetical protein
MIMAVRAGEINVMLAYRFLTILRASKSSYTARCTAVSDITTVLLFPMSIPRMSALDHLFEKNTLVVKPTDVAMHVFRKRIYCAIMNSD